jgi:hypothetical protein
MCAQESYNSHIVVDPILNFNSFLSLLVKQKNMLCSMYKDVPHLKIRGSKIIIQAQWELKKKKNHLGLISCASSFIAPQV